MGTIFEWLTFIMAIIKCWYYFFHFWRRLHACYW